MLLRLDAAHQEGGHVLVGEAAVVRRVGDVALGVAVAAATLAALLTLARGLVLAGLRGGGGGAFGTLRAFAAFAALGPLSSFWPFGTLGALRARCGGGFGCGLHDGALDAHRGFHGGAFAVVLHLARAAVTVVAAATAVAAAA